MEVNLTITVTKDKKALNSVTTGHWDSNLLRNSQP